MMTLFEIDAIKVRIKVKSDWIRKSPKSNKSVLETKKDTQTHKGMAM